MARRGSWKGPTLTLIGEKAGVSASTVDRVLHGRKGVSRRNAEAVWAACRELGIGTGDSQHAAAANQVNGSILRMALLSDAGATLNVRLQDSAAKLMARLPDVRFEVHAAATTDFVSQKFTDLMRRAAAENDALVLNCRDEPSVRRAISDIAEAGAPVVCITTDIPNSGRIAYVGMDQVAAGATAAYLLGRFAGQRTGRVVLVASASYRCQEERESGFRRVLRSEFPHIHVEESINSNDDPDFSYRNMREILQQGKPPLGVYNTAGGNTGIARAIREFDLTKEIIFVAHEGNDGSMRLLELGEIDAVLTHDVDSELERAISIIRSARANRDFGALAAMRSRIAIFLKYNTHLSS